MASIGVKVFGERRLREQLEGIQNSLAKDIARDATKEAAQILQAAARQNLNVRTGKARRSVKIRKAKRTKDKSATEVYSDHRILRPNDYYTAFLEHGFKTRSGDVVDDHAWLRPAFRSVLTSMKSRMQQVVQMELSRVSEQTTSRVKGAP